jgi:hypothetical protein
MSAVLSFPSGATVKLVTLLGRCDQVLMPSQYSEAESFERESVPVAEAELVLSLAPEKWEAECSIDTFNIGKILLFGEVPVLVGRPTDPRYGPLCLDLAAGTQVKSESLPKFLPGTKSWKLVVPGPHQGAPPAWSFDPNAA